MRTCSLAVSTPGRSGSSKLIPAPPFRTMTAVYPFGSRSPPTPQESLVREHVPPSSPGARVRRGAMGSNLGSLDAAWTRSTRSHRLAGRTFARGADATPEHPSSLCIGRTLPRVFDSFRRHVGGAGSTLQVLTWLSNRRPGKGDRERLACRRCAILSSLASAIARRRDSRVTRGWSSTTPVSGLQRAP